MNSYSNNNNNNNNAHIITTTFSAAAAAAATDWPLQQKQEIPPIHSNLHTTMNPPPNREPQTYHPKLLQALGGASTVIQRRINKNASSSEQQQQQQQTVGQLLSQNKVILLYFSAYWCKPCKRITPILKEWYLGRKNQPQQESSSFDMLFVSLDTFDKEYDYYTSDMPWWSLPLATSQALQNHLTQHYNAQGGIPTLAVIEHDRLVRMDAIPQVVQEYQQQQQQKALSSSPQSSWMHAPLTWAQWYSQAHWNLPSSCSHKNGPLHSRFVFVWVTAGPNASQFMAHTMTPLAKRLRHAHTPCTLQMLHIDLSKSCSSSDECSNVATLPSLCPSDDEARRTFLHKYPMICTQSCSLLVLGPACRKGIERCIIHPNALSDIPSVVSSPADESSSSASVLQDWIQHPFGARRYGDLNQTAIDLASTPAVVVFAEACDDCEQQTIANALQEACRTFQRHIDPCRPVWFLHVFQPQAVSRTLQSLLGLSSSHCSGGPNVTMVLVDFAQQEQFYVAPSVCDAELTAHDIVTFVQNPELTGAHKQRLASPCGR